MDKVSSRHVSWTDLENPTYRDVADLEKRYSINPLVSQELLVATHRPRFDRFDDHLLLILHFPVFDPTTNITLSREIDFIIFPYEVVTTHYEPIPQLDDFFHLLAGHENVRERNFGRSSANLLHNIIRKLFSVSLQELDTIDGRIQLIEEKVFGGQEEEVLKEISLVRRDLLNFQKALKPQQAILASLTEHAKTFFGKDAVPYFNDIEGEYIQVRSAVEDLRTTLDVLYETNISLLSINTNAVTKVLTGFASVLLPITLIATIFGMNIEAPLEHSPFAFWAVLAGMILVGLFIYRIFKKRRWL